MRPSSPRLSFEWMISPITPEDFFGNYFEKDLLLLKRNSAYYYADLLSLDDIDHFIASSGPKHTDVGLVSADEDVKATEYTYNDGSIDASRVFEKFHDGSTIILQQLHKKLPRLAAFCRALETVFSARTQTNIYLTPSEKQGFKPHYDNHDVFILQVTGSKNWQIYANTRELPLRGQTFSPDNFTAGEVIRRFTLDPGDMLYLPRGVPHAAVSDSEISLHITTGLLADTWTDLILDAVSALALEEPAFRRSVPPGFANAGFDRSSSRTQFRNLLAALSERADMDAAFDRLATEFVSKRHPLVPGQMGQIRRLSALDLETEVGVRPNLIYRLDEEPPHTEGDDGNDGASAKATEGTIVVQCYGKQVRLPAHTRDAILHALTSDRYRVRDIPGDLDDDGKIVLMRRLIREGMVMMLD